MSTTPVEILIRTDALRRILEDDPEVKLRLQNTAIEKCRGTQA